MTTLRSWVPVPDHSDFSIHNLPFGVFSTEKKAPGAGVAIGEKIVDLAVLARKGFLSVDPALLEKPSLNDFIRQGKKVTTGLRMTLQQLLSDADSPLKEHPELLIDQALATMHLPVEVGDYTDYYSSMEHAINVGKMFRDPEKALLPNWKHLPVAYHGRASSIIPSGVPIHRPKGQVMPNGAEQPVYQASDHLDFELELAFIIGKESALGDSISIREAESYIFGLLLFNDWSARDIQKWEYVPLGPFLGKNFASSLSPWIVTLEALDPFRVAGPDQDPSVLSYLNYEGLGNFDIDLEVSIQPDGGEEQIVSRSNFKYMYWNMAQQLAHHTVNGCNVRVGDLLASGTISGKKESSFGSMLELAWAGTKPLQMKDGSTRVFINDHDTVTMRGHAEKGDLRVGFGKLQSRVLPAK